MITVRTAARRVEAALDPLFSACSSGRVSLIAIHSRRRLPVTLR
jgi:hypothetical protein